MSKVVMRDQDEWDDEPKLVEYLSAQLQSGRLGLALGAGISKPFGLPDWGNLINAMFKSASRAPVKGNPMQQAEYIRTNTCGGDVAKFLELVDQALYENADTSFDALRKNDTIASVGALLMASRRGSASEVVTTNFDNLLELYLTYFGFVVHSVAADIHWRDASDVTIYHPHGFLPHDQPTERSDDIVLDQASFGQTVGKDTVWRQVCMNMFRRRTCLFIGMSGDDPNIESMLQESRDTHASKNHGTRYWGVAFSTSNDDLLRTQWQNRGVYYRVIKDYDHDLPRLLFGICQRAAEKSMFS